MSTVHGATRSDEVAARILVDTGAVSFRTAPFFRFTSGVESPIYVDNRRLLGFAGERRTLVAHLIRAILRDDAELPDAVAGTATAGIAWAAWIADRLDLPMLYVRSSAKEHGQKRAVEGFAPAGADVCVVEDLAFTARSLVTAGEQLRAAGYTVRTALTLVTYDTPVARSVLENAGIRHISLTTIDHALAAAVSRGTLDTEQAAVVEAWLGEQRKERS
jgi:orotate phosphoribosyltransferase